jgi:hypothetical protein
MAQSRASHRPAAYSGEYPYRVHKGRGRAPRTPLIGDFEGGEEDVEGFGYREMPKIYPTVIGEERIDSLESAVTPMNIAIGATLLIVGIAAYAYFTNKNNPQAQVERPNIL